MDTSSRFIVYEECVSNDFFWHSLDVSRASYLIQVPTEASEGWKKWGVKIYDEFVVEA